MQTLALVVSVLAGLCTMSRGCSIPEGGYKTPTLDWKMMNSDVVVHGVSLSRQPDKNYQGFNVYSVQFEIRCIYKGGPLDEKIWIDEVGFIPGHCHATNLTEGEHYLVYLGRREKGRFHPLFVQDPGNEDYLDEITALCETSVSYPTGYSIVHNKEECPEKQDDNDCMPKPVPTTFRPEVEWDNKSPASRIVPIQVTKDNGDVEYKPVVSQDTPDDNSNGSAAVTLGTSALICLMLSALLL